MRHIKEFQILDINAVVNGLDIHHLMNNAGNSLAKHILDQFSDCTLFIFVCGKGNNAGDGYVAASNLHDNNFDVIVINVEGEIKPTPQKALELYKGRIESILSSLPADVKWQYKKDKEYNVLENKLLDVINKDWNV